jgi:DNA-binding transcriptional LysR family regulator
MDTLDGIKTVVAVVETGSFTAASERLGMSKALVSKYIGEVEDSLGVRLLNRSTRRLALTEAGQRYYDQALPLLEEFEEMVDSVTGEQSSPRGLLRISVPVTFGEMSLAPLIPKFLQQYPDIGVDLQLSDKMIDMLEEGIDVVIRIGGVDDSSLIAKHIQTLPLALCASPDAQKICLKRMLNINALSTVISALENTGRLFALTI